MASETLKLQDQLEMLKTVPASSVPSPSDGPVMFADSADRPTTTIRAKTPDGETHDVIPQSGTTTLVAGTTELIPATITASKILITLRDPITASLTVDYAALEDDRVVGLAADDGGFILTALVAAKTINVADESVLDWVVFN
jgi:hypothetical protein